MQEEGEEGAVWASSREAVFWDKGMGDVESSLQGLAKKPPQASSNPFGELRSKGERGTSRKKGGGK